MGRSSESFKNTSNTKLTQIKTISTEIEKNQSEIKKFVGTRNEESFKVEKKIAQFKKKDIPENPLISVLKSEKDSIENKEKLAEKMNIKLQKQLIEVKKKMEIAKIEKSDGGNVIGSMKFGGIMRLFESNEFVLKNCGKLSNFKSKLENMINMCSNSNKEKTKAKSLITKRKKKKKKKKS